MDHNKQYICSLDIGTSEVRAVIAVPELNNNVRVVGEASVASSGLRRGMIVDIEAVVDSIEQALSAAEHMAGHRVKEVFAGFSAAHARLEPSRGMVAISGENHEVSQEDVDRVISGAQHINLSPTQRIIDTITKEFIIDDEYNGIKNPAGMAGVRLELQALLVTGSVTAHQNISRCVELADRDLLGLVLNPLALASVSLDRDAMELGTVLIDIGAGKTEIAFFEGGVLSAIASVPIGGELVTSDLAYGLSVSVAAAEECKLKLGDLLDDRDGAIEIPGLSSQEPKTVSRQEALDIVVPRIQEIFRMSHAEMQRVKIPDHPGGGIMLAGGVSLTPGIRALCEDEFEGVPVRIARPATGGGDSIRLNTAVGIARYTLMRMKGAAGAAEYGDGGQGRTHRTNGLWDKLSSWMRDMWE